MLTKDNKNSTAYILLIFQMLLLFGWFAHGCFVRICISKRFPMKFLNKHARENGYKEEWNMP